MEFSPIFMFCRNLKKRSRKTGKKKKEANAVMLRHQKNNVAKSYGECHASIATSVEIVISEFCNVAT